MNTHLLGGVECVWWDCSEVVCLACSGGVNGSGMQWCGKCVCYGRSTATLTEPAAPKQLTSALQNQMALKAHL